MATNEKFEFFFSVALWKRIFLEKMRLLSFTIHELYAFKNAKGHTS